MKGTGDDEELAGLTDEEKKKIEKEKKDAVITHTHKFSLLKE